MDILNTLRILTEKSGVSGDELSASKAALELLKEYTENAQIDPFGNVTGIIKSGKASAKTLMLDAHIDKIGMVVTYIDEKGFIKVGGCGGLDMRVMLAQSVTVHGKKPLRGVISSLPPHISSDHSKVPEIGDISVDIGMTREQAENIVSLGDSVTIDSPIRQLGAYISASAIDDRAGVCAVLYALEMLKGKELSYDIAVCFSAQEETGERGVKQAAYRLNPDKAIIVDVSFAKTPDSADYETAKMGSGAMIGASAVLCRKMTDKLQAISKKNNIPYTIEVMPSSTGTNADAVSVVRGGVRCATVSIPIRYMHTPVETVDIEDIRSAARLIAAYAEDADND